jgi:hypothetical protein
MKEHLLCQHHSNQKPFAKIEYQANDNQTNPDGCTGWFEIPLAMPEQISAEDLAKRCVALSSEWNAEQQ